MSIFDWFKSASVPRETAARMEFTPPSLNVELQVDMPPVKPSVKRAYQAAQHSRLTGGWATSTSSADSEIRQSLTNLRARSRALCRDSAYAKRARTIVTNNVIGSGMGLQAQVKSSRNTLHERANDAIEAAWERWARAEFCHTGGALHFSDFERAITDEVFEAGEVFVRMHDRAFGGSAIPFALELIESERVPHEFVSAATSNDTRLGVEVDNYYRPLRYWIRERHPNDVQPGGMQTDRMIPVPASDVIHLRIIDRWPQTRGVPWLHAVARKLNDMDGYSEAEIVAARASAQPIGWEEPDALDPTIERNEDGTYETEYQPGFIHKGKKLNFYTPSRPNTALDPFMRYMLREVAAGVGVSYESLSRDYSQSNYSSSRLSLLDDRDLWRVLQMWFIRSFRDIVHRRWLQQAVFARAIDGISIQEYASNREKFEAVKYKPRGWSWVDPTKEVEAYKEAIKAGFTTRTAVIAQTASGADIEDVDNERRRELDAAAAMDLSFDTDPQQQQAAEEPAKPTREEEPDSTEEGRQMRLVK